MRASRMRSANDDGDLLYTPIVTDDVSNNNTPNVVSSVDTLRGMIINNDPLSQASESDSMMSGITHIGSVDVNGNIMDSIEGTVDTIENAIANNAADRTLRYYADNKTRFHKTIPGKMSMSALVRMFGDMVRASGMSDDDRSDAITGFRASFDEQYDGISRGALFPGFDEWLSVNGHGDAPMSIAVLLERLYCQDRMVANAVDDAVRIGRWRVLSQYPTSRWYEDAVMAMVRDSGVTTGRIFIARLAMLTGISDVYMRFISLAVSTSDDGTCDDGVGHVCGTDDNASISASFKRTEWSAELDGHSVVLRPHHDDVMTSILDAHSSVDAWSGPIPMAALPLLATPYGEGMKRASMLVPWAAENLAGDRCESGGITSDTDELGDADDITKRERGMVGKPVTMIMRRNRISILSDSKDSVVKYEDRYRPLEEAPLYRYWTSMSKRSSYPGVLIDLDRADGMSYLQGRISEGAVPPCSWIIVNHENGHVQACWQTPAWDAARADVSKLYSAAYATLRHALCGDPCFVGSRSQNPLWAGLGYKKNHREIVIPNGAIRLYTLQSLKEWFMDNAEWCPPGSMERRRRFHRTGVLGDGGKPTAMTADNVTDGIVMMDGSRVNAKTGEIIDVISGDSDGADGISPDHIADPIMHEILEARTALDPRLLRGCVIPLGMRNTVLFRVATWLQWHGGNPEDAINIVHVEGADGVRVSVADSMNDEGTDENSDGGKHKKHERGSKRDAFTMSEYRSIICSVERYYRKHYDPKYNSVNHKNRLSREERAKMRKQCAVAGRMGGLAGTTEQDNARRVNLAMGAAKSSRRAREVDANVWTLSLSNSDASSRALAGMASVSPVTVRRALTRVRARILTAMRLRADGSPSDPVITMSFDVIDTADVLDDGGLTLDGRVREWISELNGSGG